HGRTGRGRDRLVRSRRKTVRRRRVWTYDRHVGVAEHGTDGQPVPRGADHHGVCARRREMMRRADRSTLVVCASLALFAGACRQSAEVSRATPSPVVVPPPPPAMPAVGLYVTNELSGDLSVIDAATLMPVTTIRLGKRPRGLAASRDGHRLYVALSGSP